MKITVTQIKKVRELTGAPILRVKKVLEQENGNEKKAVAILKKEGFAKIAKRKDRTTKQGAVFSYTHHNGKIIGLVELLCETDFVARNDLFQRAGQDIAMQIASMDPKNVKELENQDFIKDPGKKVGDIVKEIIAKTGENINIGRIYRLALGE